MPLGESLIYRLPSPNLRLGSKDRPGPPRREGMLSRRRTVL